MDYFLHDNFGKIIQFGTVSEKLAHLMVREGCEFKEGAATLNHYWDGKSLRKIPDAPSKLHTFNYVEKRWVAEQSYAWSNVRVARDKLLSDCDWRVTKAMEGGTALASPWVEYRQALRDITSQPDPFSIVWPVVPI